VQSTSGRYWTGRHWINPSSRRLTKDEPPFRNNYRNVEFSVCFQIDTFPIWKMIFKLIYLRFRIWSSIISELMDRGLALGLASITRAHLSWLWRRGRLNSRWINSRRSYWKIELNLERRSWEVGWADCWSLEQPWRVHGRVKSLEIETAGTAARQKHTLLAQCRTLWLFTLQSGD
jgi:hypothetical protein